MPEIVPMPQNPLPQNSGPQNSVPETPSLADQVSAIVLAVPGVRRLEPSLVGGLRRVVRSSSVADGVLLVRVGERLEATIDIAVDQSRSAMVTATEVEAAVTAVLQAQHAGPVAVTVRVLSVSMISAWADPTP